VDVNRATADLEARCHAMQELANQIKESIYLHEFDMAAQKASALELRCKSANLLANKIADADY
jgi:hypothetical protein